MFFLRIYEREKTKKNVRKIKMKIHQKANKTLRGHRGVFGGDGGKSEI